MFSMKYKAVCFDIDGTLYPESEVVSLLSGFVKRHPLLNLKYSKMRLKFRELQETDSKIFKSDYSFREREAAILLGKNTGYEKIKRTAQMLENKYYRNLKLAYTGLKQETEPLRVLNYLKEKNVITGVLTDWPLFDKLERLGLKQFMDFEITSEETGFLKPSAKCFNYMLDRIGFRAQDVLFVGDSYPKDISGAHRAGMDAVLINNTEQGNFSDALKVFSNFKEFENWILSL